MGSRVDSPKEDVLCKGKTVKRAAEQTYIAVKRTCGIERDDRLVKLKILLLAP